MSRNTKTQTSAMRAAVGSFLLNLVLSIMKITVGALSGSSAMVSDGAHSIEDVFETFLVIIGVKLAGRAPDEKHPNGYRSYEAVFGMVLAAILMISGIEIGYEAVQILIHKNYGVSSIPSGIAVLVAAIAVTAKEIMSFYCLAAAKKSGLTTLRAEGLHHQVDALVSLGAMVGVIASRNGHPEVDPIMSVAICLLVVRSALEILKDALNTYRRNGKQEDTPKGD